MYLGDLRAIIWADQGHMSWPIGHTHCVFTFSSLQPTKGIYNDKAHQALKSEELHRAFDLTSHPWAGANHTLSGGCSWCRALPVSEGLLNSRQAFVGSIFLKQPQLRFVSKCIYFTNSLVFFQGVGAMGLLLLEWIILTPLKMGHQKRHRLYVCCFPTTEKLGRIEVKDTPLESDWMGSNCNSTTSHHCDPGQVLNVADAASSLLVHWALTYSHASWHLLTARMCKKPKGFHWLQKQMPLSTGQDRGAKKVKIPQSSLQSTRSGNGGQIPQHNCLWMGHLWDIFYSLP